MWRVGGPAGASGDGNANEARKLAEELSWLPLALEHAGAYCEATGMQLAGYLQLFRTQRRQFLEKEHEEPVDYPATVWTTWEAAVERIRKE